MSLLFAPIARRTAKVAAVLAAGAQLVPVAPSRCCASQARPYRCRAAVQPIVSIRSRRPARRAVAPRQLRYSASPPVAVVGCVGSAARMTRRQVRSTEHRSSTVAAAARTVASIWGAALSPSRSPAIGADGEPRRPGAAVPPRQPPPVAALVVRSAKEQQQQRSVVPPLLLLLLPLSCGDCRLEPSLATRGQWRGVWQSISLAEDGLNRSSLFVSKQSQNGAQKPTEIT